MRNTVNEPLWPSQCQTPARTLSLSSRALRAYESNFQSATQRMSYFFFLAKSQILSLMLVVVSPSVCGACLSCVCLADQAAVMSCFAAAIAVMFFTAPPSVKTGIESEITYREHNMSKPLRLTTLLSLPLHNTQDAVIHFLRHKFTSCPYCVHYVHLT